MHASWLIDGGISVLKMSRRLGHSRPSITVDVYSHLIDRDESDIVEVLQDIDDNVVTRLAKRSMTR